MSWLRRGGLSATRTFTYSAVTAAIIVAGGGSYAFATPVQYDVKVITQDIKVNSGASWFKVKNYFAITSGDKTGAVLGSQESIVLNGGATYSKVKNPATGGGVRVNSGATWTKTLVRSATSSDIKVDSGGSWSKTLIRSATTKDIIVAGGATWSRVRNPATSGGVIVDSGASWTKTLVRSASGGVIVDSGGSYSFFGNNAHTYTGTGGVIVAGTGSWSKTLNRTGVSSNIKVDSGGSWSKTLVRSAQTADIVVSGSASHASIYVYVPITQDIRVNSGAAYAKVKAPSVTTQDIKLSGAASYSKTKAPTGSGGVIVAGGATQAITYAYEPVTQDIRLSGSATVANVKIYVATVQTQDIVVSGHGTSVRQAGYFPTGGVKIGGSYWTFGNVVNLCGIRFQSAAITSVTCSVPALASLAFTVTDEVGETADGSALADVAFSAPQLASMVFYGGEPCDDDREPGNSNVSTETFRIVQTDGSAILLADGSGALKQEEGA